MGLQCWRRAKAIRKLLEEANRQCKIVVAACQGVKDATAWNCGHNGGQNRQAQRRTDIVFDPVFLTGYRSLHTCTKAPLPMCALPQRKRSWHFRTILRWNWERGGLLNNGTKIKNRQKWKANNKRKHMLFYIIFFYTLKELFKCTRIIIMMLKIGFKMAVRHYINNLKIQL